jgi:hypothetical protein
MNRALLGFALLYLNPFGNGQRQSVFRLGCFFVLHAAIAAMTGLWRIRSAFVFEKEITSGDLTLRNYSMGGSGCFNYPFTSSSESLPPGEVGDKPVNQRQPSMIFGGNTVFRQTGIGNHNPTERSRPPVNKSPMSSEVQL